MNNWEKFELAGLKRIEIPEHSLMAEACANDLNLSCKERLS